MGSVYCSGEWQILSVFGGNDIQNDEQYGGIGVAVADNPAGPFKDVLGKPLIDKIVNGAQPIDQFVLKMTMVVIICIMEAGIIVIW